jgi:hypothetical protein
MRAEGTNRFYRLELRTLESMNRDIFSVANMASLAPTAEAEGDAFERKVMKAFTENGRIKEIPAQYKKKLVLLRWLIKEFEPGRRYAEAEVNEILKRFHGDFASLRRYMIENGFMARESGVYWRLEQ